MLGCDALISRISPGLRVFSPLPSSDPFLLYWTGQILCLLGAAAFQCGGNGGWSGRRVGLKLLPTSPREKTRCLPWEKKKRPTPPPPPSGRPTSPPLSISSSPPSPSP